MGVIVVDTSTHSDELYRYMHPLSVPFVRSAVGTPLISAYLKSSVPAPDCPVSSVAPVWLELYVMFTLTFPVLFISSPVQLARVQSEKPAAELSLLVLMVTGLLGCDAVQNDTFVSMLHAMLDDMVSSTFPG